MKNISNLSLPATSSKVKKSKSNTLNNKFTSTGEELTEGDWMPVRPEDDDIYITPDGTYKFNRWPTCYCSYGRSYWYGAPNATERLASIAGRPVIK